MDSLRRLCVEELPPTEPCCRCSGDSGRWDRIGGKPYCPRCEEALILGEIEPVREHPQELECTVCGKIGTLSYLTFPLHADIALELQLCADHFRSLLGRHLPPHAFHQLRRMLNTIQLQPGEVFLLHDAFYNPAGKALRPIQVMAD
jgi:hypothetical protein